MGSGSTKAGCPQDRLPLNPTNNKVDLLQRILILHGRHHHLDNKLPVPAESPPLPNPFPPPPRAASSHSRHKSTGAVTPEMISNPLPSHQRTSSMRSQNFLTPDMGMSPLPSLRRVPSNLSQRSHGKFEHFDKQSYVDPAIIGGGESQVDLGRIPSRPASSVGFGLARTRSRGSTVRGE